MSEERETYTATPALDLDAIEARANAATPGPWDFYEEGSTMFVSCGVTQYGEALYLAGDIENREDATFIAAARSDVPALVAEVRRLARWLRMIADRPDAEMQQAKTLHWDMRGWARYALDGIEAPAMLPFNTNEADPAIAPQRAATSHVVRALMNEIHDLRADVERIGRERDDMARANAELQERLCAREDGLK
jgi:hypothetical protein